MSSGGEESNVERRDRRGPCPPCPEGSDEDLQRRIMELQTRLFQLETVCERAALVEGNELDSMLEHVENGINHTHSMSGLQTTKPFTAALAQWTMHVFLVLMVLGVLGKTISTSMAIQSDFTDVSQRFVSLQPLETEQGLCVKPPVGSYFESFAVSQNGFELLSRKSKDLGNSLQLEFDSAVAINGFRVTTRGWQGGHPGFAVLTSPDGEEWTTIYVCAKDSKEVQQAAQGGNIVVTWASKARRWCFIGAWASLTFCLVGYVATIVLAVLRHHDTARIVFAIAFADSQISVLLLDFFPWKGFSLHHPLLLVNLCFAPVMMVFSARLALSFLRDRDVSTCAFHFGAFFGLHYALLIPTSWVTLRDVGELQGVAIGNALIAVFVMVGWYQTRRLAVRANELVQPAKQRYQAVWREVSGAEGAGAELEAMQRTATRISEECEKHAGGPLRHLHRCGVAVDAAALPGPSLTRTRRSSVLSRCASLRVSERRSEGAGEERGYGEAERARLVDSSLPPAMTRGEPHSRDPACPVRSLDQLYQQGATLDPLLRRLVLRWAAAGGGYLPRKKRCTARMVRRLMGPHALGAQYGSPHGSPERGASDEGASRRGSQEGYSSEEGAGEEEDRTARMHKALVRASAGEWPEGEVRWGALKSPARAVEKALRSHAGEVAKVIDLCRHSIIFDSLHELHACLQAMEKDDSVSILRVKNRLSPDWDDEVSAGYRDVLINLVVSTEEAARLGVEGHVSEIQLILYDFYALKSDEGHKRYVDFRNMRIE